jgi:hydrogenase maturation protease
VRPETADSPVRLPLLVLGVGNTLCTDDGAGPAAVERLLERWDPPIGVRVLDGGTLGLSLLPILADADAAILLDAVRVGEAPPGTLVRLTGDDVPTATRQQLTVHQVGVADLLDGLHLLGRLPERLVLLGVVPESIEIGYGVSACVEPTLEILAERAVAEAAALGFRFRPREEHDAEPSLVEAGAVAAGRAADAG